MRRVCSHMRIFPHHIRAPHAEPRIFFCDNVSCSGVGVLQPRHAQDAPDGVRRSAVEAACASLGPYDPGRWTDGFSSLAEHASGSAALPLDSPDSRAPCRPHRAAAGSLACSCRAECPATEHGHRQFSVPRLAAASQSPTRVPVATESLSAMESLRLGPLAVHDDVGKKICTAPHSLVHRGRTAGFTFPHDTAESYAA
ncbi:hypothetical protein C3747_162g24 [Trypanosoma cruzi]|uniref:Uncharacterized protein n=2 Tax=Trypanosoma cruzi TaxID=5693 RepID=Q4D2F6_TRYCC|nr:hypothetical protein Tc00.1047053509615.60 [Trypanosoma cruzi]EAN86710.1 hypothetical protein Tc00.1047053509615.60 [Trypanosoma cruzi]PWV04068.1 hypothetical protein C3747_162g24 [Trypanosoma cruzi]|eukprot:XP_808561.1 hypothetical protein [Trypanosoma cruzi strain CL Brener]